VELDEPGMPSEAGADLAASTGPGTAAPAGVDLAADEVDVDVALLDAIERDLADVEVALARIDDGTYGSCEVCGGPIAEAELVRSPATRLCQDHLPLTAS